MANKALQWNCVGTTADNRKCKANLDGHGNPKWSRKYKSRPQATSAVFKRKPQQGQKCCAACYARHYDLMKSNENKGARGKRKGAAPTDAGLSSRPKIAQSNNELNRLSIGSNSSVPVRTCKPAKTAAAATPASAKRATVVPESAPSVACSSDSPFAAFGTPASRSAAPARGQTMAQSSIPAQPKPTSSTTPSSIRASTQKISRMSVDVSHNFHARQS